jgi:hypothetical protein
VTGAASARAGTISIAKAARTILHLRNCFMGSSFSLDSFELQMTPRWDVCCDENLAMETRNV